MREKMFILNQFRSHNCKGIECELMFKMAAEAGCYIQELLKFTDEVLEIIDRESAKEGDNAGL